MAQLFTQAHYDAFIPSKHTDDAPEIQRERERVRDQFLWLDKPLAEFIQSQGWDLHRHRQTQHYTSSTHFIWINVETKEVDDREGLIGRWQPIVKEIGWLWLHYGKSRDQLNLYKNIPGTYQYTRRDDTDYYNAFYVHTRIQFHLSNTQFGVSVLYTDKDRFDKSEFLKNLKQPQFETLYWNAIQRILDRGFCYFVNDNEFPLISGIDRKEFFSFVRTSHQGGYSGVRKMYDPNDPAISIENIVGEMQGNLVLLYPLYDLMAHRQKSDLMARQKKPPKNPVDVSKLFGGNVHIKKKRKKELA